MVRRTRWGKRRLLEVQETETLHGRCNGGWIAVVREHGYAVVALRGRHSKAEDDYSPDVSQRESHLFAIVSPPRVFEISKFSNFSIEKSVDTKSGFHDETFFDGEKSEL